MSPGDEGLWDWFAGKALPAVIRAAATLPQHNDVDNAAVARTSYDIADAMMAERKRRILAERE